MAQYNYFWDLASSQAYNTHTIKQIDANTTTGGGTFKWVSVANNTTIDNIPGIRIKPTANTKGYWERVIDGPWLVDWFGCVNIPSQFTLTGYGLTAGDIAARFNCVTKNIDGTAATPSNTIVGTDTYDTAAMKLAFNLMELGYTSAVQFLTKDYYLSNTCNLPLSNGAGTLINSFAVIGNNAKIRLHNTLATTVFWDRNIVDSTAATSQINVNSKFLITDLNFFNDSVLSSITFIRAKAIINSKLTNLSFKKGSIEAYYCLDTEFSNLRFDDATQTAFLMTSGLGGWTGGSHANSQSSNCKLDNIKIKTTQNTFTTGISLLATNNIVINNFFIDAINTPLSGGIQGIYFDAANQLSSNTFKVTSAVLNVNYAALPNNAIGIDLKPYGTNVQLDNLSNAVQCVLVKSDATYGSTNNITIRNINTINPSTIFHNITTNNYWVFENCKIVDPLSNTKWVGGVSPVTGAWVANGAVVGGTTRLREAYPFAAK